MTRMAGLALALVLAFGGSAAEAAKPKPVGRGYLYSDGVRYAVVVPLDGSPPRVLDTDRGSATEIADQPGYDITGVGGGQVLWASERSGYYRDPPRLTDIASGLTRTPPGWETVRRESGDLLPRDVGAEWLTVWQSGNHFNFPGFLNWHTGAWVVMDPGPANSQPDLDRPDLMEPLCAPFVRRPAQEDSGGIERLGFPYSRPYAIFQRGNRVQLGRCGSRKRTTLFRTLKRVCPTCSGGVDHNSLLPWRPVWAGAGRRAPIRAYLPRKRRTEVLARMRRGYYPSQITIDQTRTTVFVRIRDARVYSLRAPR